MRKIVIVGAGPGGLTAAMLLAYRGFEVHVYEKADRVGGRSAALTLGEYTFDTGPTFLLMKPVLEAIFTAVGESLSDHLELINLDPIYRLHFLDKTLDVSSNPATMCANLQAAFPGEIAGYEKFLRTEAARAKRLIPLFTQDYSRWQRLFTQQTLASIPLVLSSYKSVYGQLSKYFQSEQLKTAFSFQSKYLGMSPWKAPGAFSTLAYLEHAFGVYHVTGGLNKISQAMATVAKKFGAQIHLSQPVQQITVQQDQVKGIRLSSGEEILADDVIVNADFAYAAQHLFPAGTLKKYTSQKLHSLQHSCSTFMLYLGVNKQFNTPHHQLFFARDYQSNSDDIIKKLRLPKDNLFFYVCNPSKLDSSLAPPGKSALYVLVPVPNNFSNIIWEDEKAEFRNLVLQQIAMRTPFGNLEPYIEHERVITPADWEINFNVAFGALFSLAHTLNQMLYWRPHNKFEEVDNCYLVGGGTHPGSGLPSIYASGLLAANLISQSAGQKVPHIKLL